MKGKIEQDRLTLIPTQSKLSLPIVERIYKKMKSGIEFDAIKVHSNLIIDGHHRYVASILAGVEIESFPTTKNHNQTIFTWQNISIVTIDFDTEDHINYLNFNDAKRNGMTIEQILEIIRNC